MFARQTVTMAVAAVLILPAIASARPGNGPGRHPRALSIKDRVCVGECRGETGQCLGQAHTAAQPCYEACQPLVTTARAVCADDPTSDPCHDAAAAARTCLAPCRDLLHPAVSDCLTAGRDCLQDCPLIGDPPCFGPCRADYAQCLAAVRKTFTECRRECSDELQTARRACAANPDSDACAAARAAARACLDPCYETARTGLRECRRMLRECVAGCATDAE